MNTCLVMNLILSPRVFLHLYTMKAIFYVFLDMEPHFLVALGVAERTVHYHIFLPAH